ADEVREGALLAGELLRVLERALQDEPRHRVDVDGGYLTAQTHGFKRNRAAAGKWIENTRCPTAIGFADLLAEVLDVRLVLSFAAPVKDPADGLLDDLLFTLGAGPLLLFDLLDDLAADALA